MKVSELREWLKTQPQDAEIYLFDGYNDYVSLTMEEDVRKGYMGENTIVIDRNINHYCMENEVL